MGDVRVFFGTQMGISNINWAKIRGEKSKVMNSFDCFCPSLCLYVVL